MHKLTKECAIEINQEIANRHELDDENGYKEASLYLWFIESFRNGFYEHDEAIEIANIIINSARDNLV
jgi:hypothetical protein